MPKKTVPEKKVPVPPVPKKVEPPPPPKGITPLQSEHTTLTIALSDGSQKKNTLVK